MYAPLLSAAFAAALALSNPALSNAATANAALSNSARSNGASAQAGGETGIVISQASSSPAELLVPAPEDVMTMPPEMRKQFQAEVLSQTATPPQRLQQLLHFMLDADALAIVYDEQATYSVEQTYAMRRANCLSLTLVFLALAREAGLEANAQEIQNTLSWRQDEGTIYRNNHINAGVRINGRMLTVDTTGDAIIAIDRPAAIGQARLLAHFYNNLAMAQLADGHAIEGLRLMKSALAADASYAPLWSNLGVLHVRLGELPAAERAYLQALALDPTEDGALFNMVGLTRRLGDAKRENDYRRRLARVQRSDPLHHFLLAMDAQRSGDYRVAIAEFRLAIRLHPGEHRFWSALADAYLRAGDPKRAAKALVRAQSLSDGATRAAYRAQLRDLRRTPN